MFKVGDKVTSPKFGGVGEVVHVRKGNTYEVKVLAQGIHENFTSDGQYVIGGPVALFHVKKELVTVSVITKVIKYFEITEAEQRLILSLGGNKPQAIAFMKNQYDLPLIEAKRLCVAVWESN